MPRKAENRNSESRYQNSPASVSHFSFLQTTKGRLVCNAKHLNTGWRISTTALRPLHGLFKCSPATEQNRVDVAVHEIASVDILLGGFAPEFSGETFILVEQDATNVLARGEGWI